DEEAKLAAQGSSSHTQLLPTFLHCKPLPASIPALRQAHLMALHKCWKQHWKTSPRYALLNPINKSLPSNKFLKLINKLDRCQSAIITHLPTGHSPLNQHLFRIHHSETPSCPHCQGITVETVHHYLFLCPHYQHKCHILHCKLKCKAESISYLLSHPDAVTPLLSFIHTIKHFKSKAESACCPNLLNLTNTFFACARAILEPSA
ncbi:hypothetical protein L208DRAFT_1520421, partial [Tricholoma matsutake]